MKFRIHRQSIILISLSVFLAGLVILNILFIYLEIRKLENDASIIGEAGIIRGSIQRITKKELAGHNADDEIRQVRQIFKIFLNDDPGFRLRGISREILVTMDDMYATWDGFIEIIRELRISPSEINKLRLYNESEVLWDKSNRTVFLVQNYSEQKLRFFRLVFVVLGINLAALILIIWMVRHHVAGKLEHYAHYDLLTGAFNKNTFNEMLDREVERNRRTGNPLSIITIDFDHFKQVNDTHGHRTGDKVLHGLSRIIRKQIRRYDLFCRTGGEEFAVLLVNAGMDQAVQTAERIRTSIEGAGVSGICLTASLGAAEYDTRESPEEFFARADRALYRAKQEGRNRLKLG